MATLQDYLGITKLRDAWPKWKANIIAVNNQVIAHVAGTADKHAAQDITYIGGFTGKTDVKAALDQAKTEIDTIVVNASIDPEVAFARDSAVKSKVFGSLDARLEEDEQDLVSYKAETTSYISPIELYGGNGDWDGISGTENSTAFSDGLSASDTVYLFLSKGRYKTSAIQIPTDKNVIIQGVGKDLTEIYCTGQFFSCINTALFSTTLALALIEGSRIVQAVDSTGASVGQLITLASTQNMEETERINAKSHSAIITAINGNLITLDRPVPCDFSITGYTVTIAGYKSGKVKIANCTVSGEFDGYFGDITLASGFEVENVKVLNRNKKYQGETSTGGFDNNQTGGTMHGFRVMYSVDTKFINPELEYLSYGIMPTIGSANTYIERSVSRNCRHTDTPTGGSQGVTCRDGLAYGCFAGYDSHEGAYDSRHYNCHSYGDEIQVKFRGRYDTVEDCSFSGGILTRHDNGIRVLTKRNKFKKSIVRTTTDKGARFDDSVSVKIDDCSFAEYVRNYHVLDMFSIEDTVITMPDGSIVGNWALWLASARINVFRNLRILGEYSGVDQTSGTLSANLHSALRVDRNDLAGTVLVSNIEINGFDYGMNFPVSLDLSKFTFENIQVKNCVKGIMNAANYKDNGAFNGLTFTGCATNIVEPFRFRFTSITGKVNQSLDVSARTFCSDAMPTTGTWKIGDYAMKTNPSELGTAGSKYILHGWKRLTTGTTNVLNVDWFEHRGLTGN